MSKTQSLTAISVLIIVATFLRAGYLNYGLPYVPHADELTNYNVLQKMVSLRDPNPEFFRYPSLLFYLNAPGQIILSNLTGGLVPIVKQSLGNGIAGQSPGLLSGLLIARVGSMIFGVALPLLIWRWAWVLGVGGASAMLAGLLVALGPLLIRHSAYFTPDITASFLVSAALFAATILVKSTSARSYVIAGIFAGLAASVKYNAGLVAIAIIAAHLIPIANVKRRIQLLILSGACAIAALVFTSPYLLLDYQNAWDGFTFELQHYARGHPGAEGDTLSHNIRWVFQQTGWVIFLAIGWPLTSLRKLLFPTLVFIAAYFLLLSAQNVRFERNILPILPPILLISTVVTADLIKRFTPSRFGTGTRSLVLWGIIAFGYWAPLITSKHDLLNYDRDPKQQARMWLEQLIPSEASVAVDAYSPYLTPENRQISAATFILNQDLGWFNGLDYVVLSRAGSGRFLDDFKTTTPGHQGQTYGELVLQSCDQSVFPPPPRRISILVLRLTCP